MSDFIHCETLNIIIEIIIIIIIINHGLDPIYNEWNNFGLK